MLCGSGNKAKNKEQTSQRSSWLEFVQKILFQNYLGTVRGAIRNFPDKVSFFGTSIYFASTTQERKAPQGNFFLLDNK